MSPAHEIAQRYLAAWNERDDARRRARIAETFAEGATYVDPMASVSGHGPLDDLIRTVQGRFPSWSFRLKGAADGYGDRVRFAWTLGPDGGEPPLEGTDFATCAGDGRIASVTGFLDRVPAGAA